MTLMGIGVGWIHLLNYVRLGRNPLDYSLPVKAMMWGGALAVGLLLDALAGFYLRPFFVTLRRLWSGEALPPGQAEAAATRAIRFPERAATLLLAVSAAMILLHRAVSADGRLFALLAAPESRATMLSSMTRDMVLALLLALLLFTFSRRILRPGVAAFMLRTVPGTHRFPVGLRHALVVIVMGIFIITLVISAPENVPNRRLVWIYLPPVLLVSVVAYLLATDIGQDLRALARRLQMLAAGIRPARFGRFAVTELDEVGELVAAINTLQDRVESDFREHDRDMEAARSIQQGMLPRDWRLPPGWQLAAKLHPAREVGGDFYDLIDLGEGRFGLAVGDAAGKGLPAALLMASTVSLIRSHAPLHQRPGDVLAAVNRMLCASLPPMSFVTAVYAVVDTVRQEVRVASAGHYPPVLGGTELELPPALPLGVEPDVAYAEQVWSLASGEPLLIYSDGLIEGNDPSGRAGGPNWAAALGEPPITAAPPGEPPRTAAALIARLMAPVSDRMEQGALYDDVTLVALIPPAVLDLAFPSRDGAELEAAAAAARFARSHGPADRADDIATAVGEACLNAIEHGHGFRAELPVRIRLVAGPGWLEATVADSGPPYTPPAAPPDLAAQMSGSGPIRGWGFHLIRSLADAVHLEPLADGKQLRMQFGGRAHA